MSDDTTMFTTGSLQTFIAASFVIALLALGMSVYNYTLTMNSAAALLDIQSMAATPAQDDGSGERLAALEAKVEDITGHMKAMEEAAAAAAAAGDEGM